jgi:hypothetical protein
MAAQAFIGSSLNTAMTNKNEDLVEILKELWPDCEGRPRDIV